MKPVCHFRPFTWNLGMLFILCIFILSISAGYAQSLTPTAPPSTPNEPHAISVTSELVVLPVNVTDTNGNFVAGLTENNFHVYEEKRLQDLALFQREDAPVSVGLIVDHSGSMQLKLPNVITAISSFAHSGNPEDEMFVVDFNDKVMVESLNGKPFTNDSDELGKAVEAVSAQGRTALYDAVAEGLNHLRESHLQRKALIVISDGGDNASHCKRSDIIALARQSQVMIYSIALEDEFTKDQDPKLLRQLSEDTGGVAFFPESQQSVIDSSAQIAVDLRDQYVLGFVPEKNANRNPFHKVQVKVTTAENGKLRVRTRAGYSVPSETAALPVVQENASMASLSADAMGKNLR
ncbi:MAG TPA: VWA domain-containing protein [Candidatus Acidoferrales bacterium]